MNVDDLIDQFGRNYPNWVNTAIGKQLTAMEKHLSKMASNSKSSSESIVNEISNRKELNKQLSSQVRTFKDFDKKIKDLTSNSSDISKSLQKFENAIDQQTKKLGEQVKLDKENNKLDKEGIDNKRRLNEEEKKYIGNLERVTSSLKKSSKDIVSSIQKEDVAGAVSGLITSVSTSVSAFGKSSKALAVLAAGLTGLGMAVSFVIKQVQQTTDAYAAMNQAGLAVQGGFMGLRRATADGILTLDQLSKAVLKSTSAINALGPTGTQMFSRMSKNIYMLDDTAAKLGMNLDQVNDYLGDYLEIQKQTGLLNKLNEQQQQQAGIRYLRDMNTFSAIVGKSMKDIIESTKEFMKLPETQNILDQIMNRYGGANGTANQVASRFTRTMTLVGGLTTDKAASAELQSLVGAMIGQQNGVQISDPEILRKLAAIRTISPDFHNELVKLAQSSNRDLSDKELRSLSVSAANNIGRGTLQMTPQQMSILLKNNNGPFSQMARMVLGIRGEQRSNTKVAQNVDAAIANVDGEIDPTLAAVREANVIMQELARSAEKIATSLFESDVFQESMKYTADVFHTAVEKFDAIITSGNLGNVLTGIAAGGAMTFAGAAIWDALSGAGGVAGGAAAGALAGKGGGLGKLMPKGGGGLLIPLIGGYLAHELMATDAVGEGNSIAAWINKNVPGAAAIDNWVYNKSGGLVGTPYELQGETNKGNRVTSSIEGQNAIDSTAKMYAQAMVEIYGEFAKRQQDSLITKIFRENSDPLDEILTKSLDRFFFQKDWILNTARKLNTGAELSARDQELLSVYNSGGGSGSGISGVQDVLSNNDNAIAIAAGVQGLGAAVPGAGTWTQSYKALMAEQSSVSGNTKEAQYMNYFMSELGLTKSQAAGLVANLKAESNLRHDGPRGDGGKAWGLAQWHGPRRKKFEEVFGKPFSQATEADQKAFIVWEMRNTYKGAYNKLKNASTATEAASIVDQHYEQSAGIHRGKRIKIANDLMKLEDAEKIIPGAGLANLAGNKSAQDFIASRAPGKDASHTSGLDAEFQNRLAAMMADAPGNVTMFSGYRSPEQQKKLWDAAVKKYGSARATRRWVAPPGRSSHNSGRAADLGFEGGSFKSMPPEVRAWVHQNAHKYGLKFPMGHEPWHIEMQETRGGKPFTGNLNGSVMSSIPSTNPIAGSSYDTSLGNYPPNYPSSFGSIWQDQQRENLAPIFNTPSNLNNQNNPADIDSQRWGSLDKLNSSIDKMDRQIAQMNKSFKRTTGVYS